MDEIRVVDLEYKERDFEYARSRYGVAVRRAKVAPGQKVYRLVELWEKTGHSALITQVLDENDNPIANVDVVFYWPDAPDPPDPSTEVYPHDWYPNFVHGPTNAKGEVGPGMGRGAYHGEGEGGPHAVWVRDPNIPSDICEKLGMLAGTFHDHLDQKFKLVTVGEEPPSPLEEPEGKMFREQSRSWTDGPHNCLILKCEGHSLFDTRANLGCGSWQIDDLVEPQEGDVFELDTTYTEPEDRTYWAEILDLAQGGKVISERVECPWQAGKTGTWTVYLKWSDGGVEPPAPQPPPSDLAAQVRVIAQKGIELFQEIEKLADLL